MSSHFAPRGPLPDADLRSASLIDADDVADLPGELGYPCEMEEAAARIAAIAGNNPQALVLARCDCSVGDTFALDFMFYLPLETTACRITLLVDTPNAQGPSRAPTFTREARKS